MLIQTIFIAAKSQSVLSQRNFVFLFVVLIIISWDAAS